MSQQLSLWEEQKTVRPPLGSTFTIVRPGTNPYLTGWGEIGCNYRPGMERDEIYYWYCFDARHDGQGHIIMTCKVTDYVGAVHEYEDRLDEEETDDYL